ncbi:MAG: HutD family protein [Rudaea sp.]|uniref:HutD/Ves family protein n=1 Tax=Rudaea sp. TaxID=2136325 RepID=UPI0039E404C3
MRIRHLRESDYRRMRWKNGGGWTTELYSHPAPESSEGFGWRVSIAEIESDGAFSTFPQCDRWIALLEGNGMRLDFDGASPASLERRLDFVHFSGDAKTHARMIDGPMRDFNLIARRDLWRCKIRHRPLVGSMLFAASAADLWFVYMPAGSARIERRGDLPPISAGDSLLLEADAESGSVVVDGGGELVVIRLCAL